jgi:hypothetical protein
MAAYCMFIVHIYYFFVVLAMPFDDGQYWLKHVKTIIYIKLIALDEHSYPFMFL